MALLCRSRDADRSWKQGGRPCSPSHLPISAWRLPMAEPNGEPTVPGWGKSSLQRPGPSIAEESRRGRGSELKDVGPPGPGAQWAVPSTYLVFWQAQQIQSSSFFW